MINSEICIIGKRLLERGFKTWFLFFFKQIERISFKQDLIHNDLFNIFEDIYSLKSTRQIINLPPRSGKTTLAIYFIAYCLARNSKSQFIYTSFNQDLLNDNSRRLGTILNSQIYKDAYSFLSNEEEEQTNLEDDFWKEYYKNKNKRFKITNKKITTNQGGIVLFNSIGSTITGFGFGLRNYKTFSGALVIDDGNKPTQTERYKRAREKTFDYYKQTLLTRANNSTAPIINIQQRLHIEDLSGLLKREYNFNVLKKPLIENGISQLSTQYTEDRIKELKKDNYLFNSQYQQEPILQGGNIIKTEWFKTYSILPKLKRVYITGDTAFKTKESSDYSVFMLWGKDELKDNTNYYIIDMIRGKWEAPELLNNLRNFYEKWKKIYNINCLYVEDKASGIGLIQEIKRLRIPIHPVTLNKDKYTRLSDVLPKIESGYVFLPEISTWKIDLIIECEEFRADNTHEHDDIVDNISIGLSEEVNKSFINNWLY